MKAPRMRIARENELLEYRNGWSGGDELIWEILWQLRDYRHNATDSSPMDSSLMRMEEYLISSCKGFVGERAPASDLRAGLDRWYSACQL